MNARKLGTRPLLAIACALAIVLPALVLFAGQPAAQLPRPRL